MDFISRPGVLIAQRATGRRAGRYRSKIAVTVSAHRIAICVAGATQPVTILLHLFIEAAHVAQTCCGGSGGIDLLSNGGRRFGRGRCRGLGHGRGCAETKADARSNGTYQVEVVHSWFFLVVYWRDVMHRHATARSARAHACRCEHRETMGLSWREGTSRAPCRSPFRVPSPGSGPP